MCVLNQDGDTLLHDAAHGGHAPILQYLIEQRGVDANAKGMVRLLEGFNVHGDDGVIWCS